MCADNQNSDEELKIIVRKNEYYVSKKFICSVVPYFEKMFCGNMLQSKENKVELDFDEHVFDSILNWVHTGSFLIQMEDIINFYEAADYLMINERLFQPCIDYFHNNFTIEHLPVVLSQVTKSSKLIKPEAIVSFICRHFLKIVNTNAFLDYPVETVEAILKLDLMIYSEYQIFESIIKWVNKSTDSRRGLLPQLLSCVRWPFMNPDELKNVVNHESIKTLKNFHLIISSGCCGYNRSKQHFLISIHRLDNSKLRINVFDDKLFCLPIGDFTQDESISFESVHKENISDILFDSGRRGIRIDWSKKTFRWLNFNIAGETHYSRLITVVHFPRPSSVLTCYLKEKDTTLGARLSYNEYVFLESIDQYIVIGRTGDEGKWFGIFPVTHPSWFKIYKDNNRTFHATILDKVVYILTKDLEFIEFNYETRNFVSSWPFKGKYLHFDDLILASHQTKDDKIILMDKLSGTLHFFCIKSKKWIEKCQIMNIEFGSNDANDCYYPPIAFVSTFLRMKNIQPLFRRNFFPL